MCGLVGCAGASLEFKHERAFKDLLIVDTIRGPDSTGIMGATNGGEVIVFKKALLPNDLFTMSGCREIFSKQNHALIGHNRWATKGRINGINAHPFEFKTLVGAHNDTLTNQSLLPDYLKFDVDSENIFHSIEKVGLKDTIASLNGAYALTWYDKERRSMNIIRNKERPMFVTFTADKKVMFWASESWMLSGVLAKNDIEHSDIFDTAIHTHYEFKIPKGIIGKEDTFKMPEPVQRALDPYKAPPRPKYPRFQGGNVVNGRFMRNNGATPSTTSTQAGGTKSWDYVRGETAYFYLDKDGTKNSKFITGMLAHNTTKKVRIYTGKESWLRGNLECDDVDEVVYQGIVNGWFKGEAVIQDNSVYTVTFDNEDDEDKPSNILQQVSDDVNGLEPAMRNSQIISLQATGGTCSWCGDPITPHKDHVWLNSETIICSHCVGHDVLAKDFIKSA